MRVRGSDWENPDTTGARGCPLPAGGGAIASGGRNPGAPAQPGQVQQPAAALAPAAGEWPAYEGLIVQDIEFPDLPSANTKTLARPDSAKGRCPFGTRSECGRSIQALYATGRFADIQVEAERNPEGRSSLTFRMRANFFVGEIFVDGETPILRPPIRW